MWADDSVHICGTTSNTLEVVGIHGDVRRYPLDPKGEVHSVFACSVRSGRAAILEDSGRVLRLVSLHDGTTVGSAAALLGNTNILVSRDARWLARTTIQPDGHAMTNVVDLTDGSTRARYDNISPSAFSPDGTLLMAMDTIGGEARLIDWRTGTAVWSRPAYGMMIPAVSDGATDRLLVALNTTNPRGGSAYDEFWIVDGRGSVRPFHPVP
jgi:hypothetical protein